MNSSRQQHDADDNSTRFTQWQPAEMSTSDSRRQSERIVRSGGVVGGGTVAAVTDWLGRTVTAPAAHQLNHLVQQQQKKLVLTLTGWRRRALFGLLLTLTIIVIINLSLTLWLLRSMQFSLVNSIFFFFFYSPTLLRFTNQRAAHDGRAAVLIYKSQDDKVLLFFFSLSACACR